VRAFPAVLGDWVPLLVDSRSTTEMGRMQVLKWESQLMKLDLCASGGLSMRSFHSACNLTSPWQLLCSSIAAVIVRIVHPIPPEAHWPRCVVEFNLGNLLAQFWSLLYSLRQSRRYRHQLRDALRASARCNGVAAHRRQDRTNNAQIRA
jgi:hypothetical protein